MGDVTLCETCGHYHAEMTECPPMNAGTDMRTWLARLIDPEAEQHDNFHHDPEWRYRAALKVADRILTALPEMIAGDAAAVERACEAYSAEINYTEHAFKRPMRAAIIAALRVPT